MCYKILSVILIQIVVAVTEYSYVLSLQYASDN